VGLLGGKSAKTIVTTATAFSATAPQAMLLAEISDIDADLSVQFLATAGRRKHALQEGDSVKAGNLCRLYDLSQIYGLLNRVKYQEFGFWGFKRTPEASVTRALFVENRRYVIAYSSEKLNPRWRRILRALHEA
jgi:hypothetical protein